MSVIHQAIASCIKVPYVPYSFILLQTYMDRDPKMGSSDPQSHTVYLVSTTTRVHPPQPCEPDRLDRLYRCCFWPHTRRRSVSWFVYSNSVLEFISLAIGIGICTYEYMTVLPNGDYSPILLAQLLLAIVFGAIGIVMILLLVTGVKYKRSLFLVPHMIFSVLSIVALVVAFVFSCKSMPAAQVLYDKDNINPMIALIWFISLEVFAVVFQCGFFVANFEMF